MDNKRIPVTIISGFLGSGKTSLLNYLIANNKEKKFAIIENEFGEINIDSDLIVGVEEGVFELSNGCICCSLNTDLADTLEGIIADYPYINHLLVETTGLADPGPVANAFVSNENVQSIFRLDAIITLVDAHNIYTQLSENEEVRKQIAMADVVLLNKIDAVSTETIYEIKELILAINPHAPVNEVQYGNVGKLNLLDINAFSAKAVQNLSFQPIEKKSFRKSSLLLKKPTAQLSQQHLDNIQSHSIIIDEPLDIIKFDTWINLMLNFNAKNFYRIKGIISIAEFEQKIIFQAVNNQYVSESGGLWQPNEERKTKMVFIGKNLDRQLLQNGLEQCCFSPQLSSPEDFYKPIFELQDNMYNKDAQQALKSSLDNQKEN